MTAGHVAGALSTSIHWRDRILKQQVPAGSIHNGMETGGSAAKADEQDSHRQPVRVLLQMYACF